MDAEARDLIEAPRSVLLVEDSPGDAALIRRMLARAFGAATPIEHVQTLEACRHLLKARDMDVVLVDLHLPDAHGLEALITVRACRPQAAVVVLTGLDDQDVALGAVSAGAQDYLIKDGLTTEILARTLQHALARAQLARRLQQAERQIAQAEKLAAIARIAAGLSHDFNNTLTVIQAHLEAVDRALPPESDARANLEEILAATSDVAAVADQLLSFCLGRPSKPGSVHLQAVLESMRPILHCLLGDAISLELRMPEAARFIHADRGRFERTMIGLVSQAQGRGARAITVAIEDAPERGDDDGDGALHVEVTDDGRPLRAGEREALLEPRRPQDATAATSDPGALEPAHFAHEVGGAVELREDSGRHTVRLRLPRSEGEQVPVRTPAAPAPAPVPAGGRTLLLVEDNVMLRGTLQRALEFKGYEVLVAAGSEEALSLAQANGERVQVVLSDVLMPGTSGVLAAPELAARCPHAAFIFMSGRVEGDTELPKVGRETHFIGKPFMPRQLTELLSEIEARA